MYARNHKFVTYSFNTYLIDLEYFLVQFIEDNDSSGLGQALAYIRPLQRDLDKSPVVKVTFFLLIVVLCHLVWDSLFTSIV